MGPDLGYRVEVVAAEENTEVDELKLVSTTR